MVTAFSIRVAAAAFTLALFLTLPREPFVLLVLFLGLGHFVLAYWYQADAGKWGVRRSVMYGLSFALLFAAVQMRVLPIEAVMLAVGIAFPLHHVLDEAHLLRKPLSLFAILEVLPFAVFNAAFLLLSVFKVDWLGHAYWIAAGILAVYLVLAVRTRRKPDTLTAIYLHLGLMAVLLERAVAMGMVVPQFSWIVLILALSLSHYLVWYAEYWRKLRGKPAALKTYLIRASVVNAIALGLAVIWVLTLRHPILSILFGTSAFYIWVLLHIVSSFRWKLRKSA